MVQYGDYRFTKDVSWGMKTRWKCSTHNTKQCRANIHTVDDEVVRINNIHNH